MAEVIQPLFTLNLRVKELLKKLSLPPLYVAIPLLVSTFCIIYILIDALFVLNAEEKRTVDRQLQRLEQEAAMIVSICDLIKDSEMSPLGSGIHAMPCDSYMQHFLFSAPDGRVISHHRKAVDPIPDGMVSITHRAEIIGAIQQSKIIQGVEPGFHVYVIYPQANTTHPEWALLLERDVSVSVKKARSRAIQEATRAAIVNVVACAFLCYMLYLYFSLRVTRIIDNSKLLNQLPMQNPLPPSSGEFDRIQQLITESEDRLLKIADSFTDVFYVISVQFDHVYYASPSYKKVWGPDIFDLNVHPTGNWLDLVIPEDLPMVKAQVQRIYENESFFEAEFRARWNNFDDIRWFYTRAFPVKGQNGEIEFLVGFTRDIDEQKRLEEEVLSISETERRNIGHDLHDDLCQRLAAIRLRSEILTDKLKRNGAPEAMFAEDISIKIGDTVELCRNLALGLSPVNIEQEGLMHSLEVLAESTTVMHQIPCRFECPEIILIRNNASATHLYRITQELISNAARHAKPSYICIRLFREEQRVSLVLEHDGLFFTPNPGGGHSGMGLHILRYRAKALGTNLRFEPLPSGKPGTQVTCSVPDQFC